MKSLLFVVAIVALTGAMFTFAGCADQPTATTNAANPAERTYTQEDLSRTGRNSTGEAVRSLDPSVH